MKKTNYIVQYLYGEEHPKSFFGLTFKNKSRTENGEICWEAYDNLSGEIFQIKRINKGRPIGALVATASGVVGVSLLSDSEYKENINIKKSVSCDIAYERAKLIEAHKMKNVLLWDRDKEETGSKISLIVKCFYLEPRFKEAYENMIERSKKYFKN